MKEHYRPAPTRPRPRAGALGTEHHHLSCGGLGGRTASHPRPRAPPPPRGRRARQLMISPRSSAASAAIRSRQDARSSGLSRGQSATSRTTRSGALLRNERVGLPGNFLSVTLGSSSYGPVGSTSYTRGSVSPAASSAARPAPPTRAVKYTWFIVTSGR